MKSKFGWGVAFLAVALFLGVGFGWWMSRTGLENKAVVTSEPAPVHADPLPAAAKNAATPQPVTSTEMVVPGEPEPSASTNWEDKLDTVLLSDADEASKAASILELMPQADEEGKVELAQHLVNMVQDDNYAGTAELLTNSATAAAVSTVLLNDLMNRNNTLKLPMLLAVARQDDHPLKSDAKDMLELFLQEDKGTNWNEWEDAINKWLEENSQ